MDNEDMSLTINLQTGKEDKHMPQELAAKARKPKLTSKQQKQEQTIDVSVPAIEEATAGDDCYSEALLRFGIKI